MKYQALAALGISAFLVSGQAFGQDDEDAAAPAKTDAKPSDAKSADKAADGKADKTDKAEPKPAGEKAPEAKADASLSTDAVATTNPSAATYTGENENAAPSRPPVYGNRDGWNITPYGYARFDGIEDSTQSFEDGIQPNLIQRVGTYRGDHRRTIFTARDSRFGVFVGAPQFGGVKSSATIEFDFYGLVPTDARRHDSVVFAPVRIRHAYLKLETGIVDVIAGQTYDLFGWNGSFYPGTVGYLGVPGQIYHRNPQLRIEKTIHAGAIDFTAAVAAVRPGQRDSGVPDIEGGIKLAVNKWNGAATAGFGRPVKTPLSIGLSGLYRRFEVPAFRAEPGSEAVRTQGWGAAAQALIPVIPIQTIEDHSNALTLTGEFSTGAGTADMYTFMDGGSRFPLLPNPSMAAPAVQYQSNVDPGLVTFDRNFELKTVNWQAFVAGLQYYFPVAGGRLWISGIYSQVKSNNIKKLTPFPSWGGIFTKMEYIDANLGYDVTPAVSVGLSFQTVKQTFGDVSAPTPVFGAIAGDTPGVPTVPGTGGVPATARNNRGQVSLALFF